MNIQKLLYFLSGSLILIGAIFYQNAWAQTPDSIIRNRGTPYEKRPILSASNWCYELDRNSITFYPVVLNAGYTPWIPQGKGYYSMVFAIGGSGSVHREFRPRYSLPSSWRLGSLSMDKLPQGVTLPFKSRSSYYIGYWEISYPNIASKNSRYYPPRRLARYGVIGSEFLSGGNFTRHRCQLMNLMSNR